RGCIILRVVYVALLSVRRNDDRRDAGARSPAVPGWRGNVVPEPAVLVVGDDYGAIRPVGAVLHSVYEVGHVLLALQVAGVAWVLVVCADGFDERHRGQVVAGERAHEVLFVLQVGRSAGRAVGVVGIVGERLVVELEEWIRVPG